MKAISKLTLACACGAVIASFAPVNEAAAGPVGLTAPALLSFQSPVEEAWYRRRWGYRPYGYYYRPYYPRYYARPYYGYPVYGYPYYGYPVYGAPYIGFGW
jgi:hypothetical protein